MFDPYYEWLGIQSSEQPVDHYRLLGVPRFETNLTAIAAAADQRMALVACHQGGPRGGEAQRLIGELGEARACLTDAQRKMAYDDRLHAQVGGRPGYVPMRPPVDSMLPPGATLPGASLPGAAPAGVPMAPRAAPAPLPPMRTPSEPPILFGDPPVAPPNHSQRAAQKPTEKTPPDDADQESSGAGRRIWLIAGGLIAAVVLLTGAAGVGLIVFARRGGDEPQQPADDVAQEPPAVPVAPVAPKIDEALVIHPTAGSELLFTPDLAQTFGIGLKLETQGSQGVLTGWTSTDNYAEWSFELDEPGFYKCEVTYSAVSGGGKYEIAADNMARPFGGTVRSGGTGGQTVTDSRYVVFQKGGRNTLRMLATEIPGEELMVLYSIRMTYDAAKSRRQ